MKGRGSRSAGELRRRAEKRAAETGPSRPASAGDLKRLVHELQVHQIELELQNEELQDSREQTEGLLRRYAELFDFAPVGYFKVDGNDVIREVNFAGARLVELPRASVVGRVFASFVSDRDRALYGQFLAAVLANADRDAPGLAGEFALVRAAEGGFHVRVTGALREGSPPFALLAVEDVTARKVAEEALHEENRRKEEFLAALSHELRNPLAPIRNGLFLLQRTDGDPSRARATVAVIDRQVTHLTRIVEDLLDVTRIARGKIRLQRELIEVGGLVLRTVEDHRAAFDAAGISVECEVAAGCWVHADASRVAQVLGNLLANALKFTNAGGRVDVRLRREGSSAALHVHDTGVGVAPDVLARLFEPFSQAPQTLERSRGGLGLGLATVKGLVEQHGGSVTARSDGPGRGTEFVVRLPLVAAPAEHDAPHERERGLPRRVLVIDDNEDAATSLRDVLELSGHEVRVALDGSSGLDAARAFRPDVVICDIGLPGMDGYEVARRVRGDVALRETWLVAMSGYATAEDALRARDAGFDRHIAKPSSVDRLEALFAEAPPAGGEGAAPSALPGEEGG